MTADSHRSAASHDELLRDGQRALRDGRFEAALERSGSVLETDPTHQDALYLRGVAERYLGRFASAEQTLDQLLELSPSFGRAHQERGHLHLGQGRSAEALSAYQEAVRCNRTLIASW
ncbi:MAG: tetratricopeptide repeat protein [Parvularculaceae bacterium]|nr:tetratricopeptide repeat protein [Parvularculaceae bacterium]